MTKNSHNVSNVDSMMVISSTERMAKFATSTLHNEIPKKVIEKVSWHLIDTIGCALAGASLPISKQSIAVAYSIGGNGGCNVFGTDQLFSPVAAAFANASIANALDYDDGTEVSGKGLGHPGATLVAAALSAVSRFEVSGTTLIRALIAGYEINNRLIFSLQPSARRFGEVYGVSQHQAIGAAVVYGLMAGLDDAGIHNAIGLAATFTNVPSLHKYNWKSRPIVSLKDGVAPAAMAGVLSVESTLAGLIGSVDVFDGPNGYWRMLGSDQFNASYFVDRLGIDWRIMDSSFKLYPACRWLAPALEAFESLRDLNQIKADNISAIHVHTFSKIAFDLSEKAPTNEIDAQFSLPYLLGALALGLPPGPEWFKTAALNSDLLQAVAELVHIHIDSESESAMTGELRRPSASVVVKMKNGSVHKQHVLAPLGGAMRPVDYEVIREKAIFNFGVANVSGVKAAEFIRNLYFNKNSICFDDLVAAL